ncbi:MAG TPA: multicopper oxidase domain-containing protein [Vicinamibacterales bacterium]|nr:multicopper oxidase domain-containing protein [Vicinamibacterales bacterium]
MTHNDFLRLSRRELLRLGGAALVGSVARPAWADTRMSSSCVEPRPPVLDILQGACAGGEAVEAYPTSPFILYPFTELLPIPKPLAPVPKSEVDLWSRPPGPGLCCQASDAAVTSTHQIWPSQLPVIYQIKLKLAEHCVTTSKVQPINAAGQSVLPPDGIPGPRVLPASTIFGFNGQFPGPMIYGRYGEPVLVRFENHLDENPYGLDVGDFGHPSRCFLTHLHNAHTAPESDGNPKARLFPFEPTQWVDNLYLNMPAGSDDREKQSFFWFHDHSEGFTAANVYKGLVGLYPIYDPNLDPGDERYGLRLPGVPNAETGRIDYDIPLAIYDCALDDGVTPHKDYHNGCGETHKEWWGKTYFRHFPNHGFVGDVFTVNGTAYPVLEVKRRKYRLRFLDASISRIYEFKLMTGHPQPARGVQGQYQLPDGQQCMRFTQIASEGGLLPYPVLRNSFKLWPAKRREFIVDFTRYQDGTPTTKGDVIYLTNVLEMTDGRKPEEGSGYRVPMMKIVIGDNAEDNSVIPTTLRSLPDVRTDGPRRSFELQRGGSSDGTLFTQENEWLINDQPFQVCVSLATPTQNDPRGEIWTLKNGGGGWVHPMHIHMEEHQVLSRNGVRTPPITSGPIDADIDDFGKEDTIALGPGDEVVIFRRFRTFNGPYVAHCHNLAHEDHSMMFGWEIIKG